MDISCDHEYLGKVDEMENQNKAYQLEIEKIKQKMEGEKQKMVMLLTENEKLNERINQLVNANQSNENLGAEKYRQLEYQLQLKEQQIADMQEGVKEKQAQFRIDVQKLEEQLEIEAENGIKLSIIEGQKDQLQKLVGGLQEQADQFHEQKIELQSKNDKIKALNKELANVEELQSVIDMLREDLAEARQKCTQLELSVHDSENKAEDLERQLTMTKKREDQLKQNN